MQLISKFNEGIRFFIKCFDIVSKYAWVITITDAFQTMLISSQTKQIWVDKGSEFYNRLRIKKNDIEMYSTHNERKSAVAERCIRTLKNKIQYQKCAY